MNKSPFVQQNSLAVVRCCYFQAYYIVFASLKSIARDQRNTFYSGYWLSFCLENLLRSNVLVLGLWRYIVFPDQSCSAGIKPLSGKRRTNNKTTTYLSEISHFLWSTSRLRQSPRTTTCNPKRFRLRFNLNYHILEQKKNIELQQGSN